MAWDINSFIQSPYTQLAAGLLQGAQPGSNFAQGLNLGLINAMNAQRSQAATSLIGQQIQNLGQDRALQQMKMDALQRLMGGGTDAADYYAIGQQPPKPPEPYSPMAKLEADISAGRISTAGAEEQKRIYEKPLVQMGGQDTRWLSPQEASAHGLSPDVQYIQTKEGGIQKVQGQNVQEASTTAGIDSSLKDIESATGIFKPAGKWDSKAIGMQSIPGTEGNRGKQALRRAIETVLRIRTGAAAPQAEVDNYLDLYAPSLLDSDKTKQDKLDALNKFLRDTKEQMGRGTSTKSIKPPPGFTERIE